MSRAATELGVPVTHDPSDAVAAASTADGAVVVAYGRLIGSDVLEALPALNVHFSLLPRWRGAAPMERAILAGDETTGVSIMALTETLDTGPLHARAATPIGPTETLAELRERLVAMSCPLLVELLRTGPGDAVPQQGEVTWAAKISHDDLRLDWDLPAVELHRRVRLGRAWTTLAGERLRILRAGVVPTHGGPPGILDGLVVGTAAGGLRLDEVQAAGRQSDCPATRSGTWVPALMPPAASAPRNCRVSGRTPLSVIPAEAGIQGRRAELARRMDCSVRPWSPSRVVPPR